MHLKKLLTKMLLVAALLGVGQRAWAQTTVGATDNTTGYLGAKSEAYSLEDNGTWTFNFTNYNKGTGGNWDNWILECANANSDLFILRADRFETVRWSNSNTTWSDETAWTDFMTKLNGASIVMTVTRNGQHVFVSTVTTPSTGGEAFTYTYNNYYASGDLNLYLSVSNSHLTIQSAKWEASTSGTKSTTLLSQNYESYRADESLNTTLTSNGWTFQTATDCTLTATTKQETLNNEPLITNKYLQLYYDGARAARWQRWDFGVESSLTENNWTLSFNAQLIPTGYDKVQLVVAGTKTEGVTTAYNDFTNPFFAVKNGGTNSTEYTATIGNWTSETFTLASNIWYRYIINVTNIDAESNTATISVIIRDLLGNNPIFNVTKPNLRIESIGILRGIAWFGHRRTGTFKLDNIILTKDVIANACSTPTYTISGASGKERKFTLDCETEGATIFYSATALEAGADGWTEYAGEVTTTEGQATIYAYAGKNGYTPSEVINFATGRGTAITLNTPVISRTSSTSVTISSNQAGLGNLGTTPNATVYYSYGTTNGTFTGASTTLTITDDATLSAYTSLEGYTTSSTASRVVNHVPTSMVQVENATYVSSYTSGSLTGDAYEGTNSSSFKVFKYTKDEVESQWGNNIYFEEGTWKSGNNEYTKWGFRTGTWYVNNTGNSWLLLKGMKADDIILADFDAAAKSATNATYSEAYTYGSHRAYTVNADGDVELAFSRISSSQNNYFRGIYAFRNATSVTITTAGWATLYTPYALDFSDVSDIAAYTATCDGEKVTLTEVSDVPANTGIVLRANSILSESAIFQIPAIATSSTDKGNLKGSSTEATPYSSTVNRYYLAINEEGNAQFTLLNENGSIAAGKAYLEITTKARSLNVEFANEATGISEVTEVRQKADDAIYNLGGQRVQKAVKGLYIQNGKKVIVK